MKKKRFVGLFLLLFPICLFGVSSRLVKTDLQTDFSRLDQIVHNRNFYMVRKKQEIFNLKESLEGCTLDNDRCVIYKRLYDEYQKFNADSAIVYADKYEEISRRQGWGNLALQARLDKVMALILQGMYLKADQEMKNCAPIGRLPPQLQQKYAIADFEFTLRMLLGKASPDTEEVRARLQDCWNTYSRYIPEDCWIYDYYEALMTRHEVTGKLLSQLKTAPKPSIQAAMLEMALAKVYRDQKKSELCCYYLIRSAISDICKANRDAPALLFLMSVPQVRGDLNRAYLYAMACTENFESYGDVARSTYILRAQTMASKNFNDRLQGRIYLLVMILIFLLVAMVIVCVQFGFLYTKNKRKSVLLKQILHSNVKQRMMIERDLRVKQHTKEANMRLEEELKKRNANFLNDYLLISRYISEEARFRKKIFNLLVAGKLKVAIKKLDESSNAENCFGNFYHQFDTAFLNLHPDFVKRFNQYLDPDKQVQTSGPNTLSIELRIYALISLGVTDSTSIADFLHYSPQTIYNYRSKIRHSSSLPQKDFDETIEKMYYS
ncbi:MAG: DUF6377 domain-containing protein [Prevotella sp.]|jgi:hypothetical protein|nr:DUF6377 domain-containing protein [Prevotella sp.]MCH3984564.1 DUF6377 domain-containing protein [Prevotella sp.]MCH4186143.1 DUF6377 domain-containing protein [Prevotella sp.]MCH4216568.1 DUF6377 domain-containing protein [Prevotella sp.]MCH4251971.1 DUF6377 domain-containing protein [Prevotella sp.]